MTDEPEPREDIFIKDPIGFNWYKMAHETFAYRENIGSSAYRYWEMVKPVFVEAHLKLAKEPSLKWLMDLKSEESGPENLAELNLEEFEQKYV